MTPEEKQLLLKDLCARLPYGVWMTNGFDTYRLTSTFLYEYMEMELKPYLRPMSSMTGDEVLEYISLKENIVAIDDITYFFETYESIDWLNANHFDYRGLIPIGLALEAPIDMYKTK